MQKLWVIQRLTQPGSPVERKPNGEGGSGVHGGQHFAEKELTAEPLVETVPEPPFPAVVTTEVHDSLIESASEPLPEAEPVVSHAPHNPRECRGEVFATS